MGAAWRVTNNPLSSRLGARFASIVSYVSERLVLADCASESLEGVHEPRIEVES